MSARNAPVLVTALSTLSALTTTPGCLGQQVVSAPTVESADDQQATCRVARDPLNPLIIEWPGTSKVDLDAASQNGLVAVSYAGCNLKVLPACKIGGGYKLAMVTPTTEHIGIETKQDLYASLPLGAASLKGELAMGSALALDYVAVGQRIAQEDPGTPSGVSCRGATHYVRSIIIGAYSLNAAASGSAGLGVGALGVGIGGERDEKVRRIRGSGEIGVCTKTPGDPQCAAIIQLGLAELAAAPSAPLASVDTRPPAPPGDVEMDDSAPPPAVPEPGFPPAPVTVTGAPGSGGGMKRIPSGTVTLCKDQNCE